MADDNQEMQVGVAADVQGSATITYADGSSEALTKGMAVHDGDTIDTSTEGSVNITFNDDTVFAVSKNASVTIDEFIYDANQDGEGQIDISVMRGVFAYTSGFVGHEDPGDVTINTPVGSIGIRGTIFTGSIPEENSGEEFKVSILEGAIAVYPKSGGEFILDDPRESLEINPYNFSVKEMGILEPDAIMDSFNVVRTIAPDLFETVVDAQNAAAEGQQPVGTPTQETGEPQQDTENSTETQNSDQGVLQDAEPTNTQTAPETADPTAEETIELNQQKDSRKPDSPVQNANGQPQAEIAVEAAMIGDNAPVADGGRSGARAARGGRGGKAKRGTINSEAGYDSSVSGAPSIFGNDKNDSSDTTASGSHDGSDSGKSNTVPTATLGTYTAFEQSGVQGQTHSFDVSRFFKDADGDTLSYSVTSLTPLGLLSAIPIISGSGTLLFQVDNALSADGTVAFKVVATDGSSSVSKDFSFDVYETKLAGLVPKNTADSFTLTTNEHRFSALGGNDTISISTAEDNFVFGGAGDDLVTINGSDNKAFGDTGNDVLRILSGNDSLISGGAGADTLIVDSTTTSGFQVFGGTGHDTIQLGADSVQAFKNGAVNTVIDGGTGKDTLSFADNGMIDFSNIGGGNSKLHGIEVFDIANGNYNELKLDINDIFDISGKSALFIDADGNDDIVLFNSQTNGSLTASGTNVSNPFDGHDPEVYDTYALTSTTGETATLYVNIIGGASGGDVTGIT